MAHVLNVAIVSQTSDYTCWHAAAQMIWSYSQGKTGRQGPMNTMAEKWKGDLGLGSDEIVTLAEKTGLTKEPGSKPFTAVTIENLLVKYGPLWCVGEWFGYDHAIVVTGVIGDRIYFNDPDRGAEGSNSITWFNQKLFNIDGAIMYKDPAAY